MTDVSRTASSAATGSPAASGAESLPGGGDMNALLERLLDEAEGGGLAGGEPPSEATPMQPVPTVPVIPGGGGVNPLANPALLAALPALAENLGPLMGSLTGGTGGGSVNRRSSPPDRHTALLCAIKPYLSPRRQEAAETVLRLCRIWDALEKSGISLSGILGSLGGSVPPGTTSGSTPVEGGKEVT